MKAGRAPRDELLDCLEVPIDHSSLFETVEHRRRDVGGAADRRRIAELFGRLANRSENLLLADGPGFRRIRPDPRERAGAEERPRPGPKVLGGKALSHGILDVLIDVATADLDPCPALVTVLEDLSRRFGELPHDPRDPRIADLSLLPLAGLAGEVQGHQLSCDRNVAPAQSRQPVTPVLLGVYPASTPQEAEREDLQRAGEYLLARQASQREVALHPRPHLREHPGKAHQTLVFALLPPRRLGLVVEILPASRRVPADRLHNAARRRVDRDVSPGGRNLQGLDAGQIRRCGGCSAVSFVAESVFLVAESPDARFPKPLHERHGFPTAGRNARGSPPLGSPAVSYHLPVRSNPSGNGP